MLVCPIDGESYKTLPEWMQSYMTCDPQFRINDIVRTILYLQQQALEKRSDHRDLIIGRESLLRGWN